MTNNNTIELYGNMSKNGVRIIETEESSFAVLSLATSNDYINKDTGEVIERDATWHDLIAFNPTVIKVLQGLNTKARIKVTGTLSYRTFPVEIEVEENGQMINKTINKKEASIVVRKVEQAPLVKKNTKEA